VNGLTFYFLMIDAAAVSLSRISTTQGIILLFALAFLSSAISDQLRGTQRCAKISGSRLP